MATFSLFSGIGVLLVVIIVFGLILGLVKNQGVWFYILFSFLGLISLVGVSATTEGLSDLLWGTKGALVLPRSFMNIIPAAVLLYGPISDIINREIVSGIPTYTSFFFLLLVRIMSLMFTQNLPSDSGTGQDIWCTLPGFEWLENPFFPSSVFSTVLVSLYYIYWSGYTSTEKRLSVTAGGLTAIALSFAQFALGGCSSFYMSIAGQGMWANFVLATGLGAAISGMLYGGFVNDGTKNPFNAGSYTSGSGSIPDPSPPSPPSPRPRPPGSRLYGDCPDGYQELNDSSCIKCAAAYASVIDGKCVSNDPRYTPPNPPVIIPKPRTRNPIQNTSSAPSGDEQTFVAELYKNGQLITEISK
jgi:hypothetical protein